MFTQSVFTISYNHFLVILLRLSFTHMQSIQCAQTSNRFTVFLYSPTISYQLAWSWALRCQIILYSQIKFRFKLCCGSKNWTKHVCFSPQCHSQTGYLLEKPVPKAGSQRCICTASGVTWAKCAAHHTWYWVAGCWAQRSRLQIKGKRCLCDTLKPRNGWQTREFRKTQLLFYRVVLSRGLFHLEDQNNPRSQS